MHTEFDDTVKQIQLFHRAKAYPYQILLLGHMPNFRHFLHRQGVFRAPYWSCFDAIQEIKRKKAAVLSFHQLKWPEGIEFIYTPFVVVAALEKEKYAQVDFGEYGNPIRVDLYRSGKVCRRNIYDDRGFLSATVLYENGEPFYQDYLMENGIWKFRHFYGDGHVEINSEYPEFLLQYQEKEYRRCFSRLSYEDISQVICEVFFFYLRLTRKEDIFCVAMHECHTRLLAATLKEKNMILSFFSGREMALSEPKVRSMVKTAGYVIADSERVLRKLQKTVGVSAKKSMAIPPYDSRADSGMSLQFDVQKILVAVDGIEEESFTKLIGLLGKYLKANENARIHLFTRRAEYDRKQRLLEKVRKELSDAGMEEGWAVEDDGKISENNLEPEADIPVRFFVEQCVDELTVSKCMREQRLFVDLRRVPEVYLQITAISIGIPQIVRARTEFVEDGRNGRVLKNIHMLPEVLHYYLEGLKNWNHARVCSYELMKEYTTDKLLEKWRKVIDSVGGYSDFTIRQ